MIFRDSGMNSQKSAECSDPLATETRKLARMILLIQLLANGLVNGAVFALLACAFGLVYRSARVFHIAFAGLFLIPPYVVFVIRFWLNLPTWTACFVGIVAGILAGYLTELLLYRPFFFRKASQSAVLVASLGAYVIIENSIALLFGNDTRILDQDLVGQIRFGPVKLAYIQVIQFVICTSALAGFVVAIKRMRVFKAVWAMGDEPRLISVLGLPLRKYRTVVFTVSAGLAGIAGCVVALDVGVNPHMGMDYLMLAAVAVLVGGTDRFEGWIIGGLALAILQSLMVWKFSAKWTDLVTYVVLITALLFWPNGLFGQKRRLEEF